jgi:hypothetical protein
MAEGSATQPSRLIRTICLPVSEAEYQRLIDHPAEWRGFLDDCHANMPELFPKGFEDGYEMKDSYWSRKIQLRLRRIELRNGVAYTVRPSFVMPYLTGKVEDVEGPLFLRRFGVPYWGLAHVFGKDAMYWYRQEIGLGRFSVVGATVRHVAVPTNLLADEHHERCEGEKVYVATTVGGGCCLGAEVADAADTPALTEAYRVFQEEARDVEPDYSPQTVNTDGWKSTQAAWKELFPTIITLLCYLHAWLKIRDRAKHLGQKFGELSRKVWHAYHALSPRGLRQRLKVLRTWAGRSLTGDVQKYTRQLCDKCKYWVQAYSHPGGHRTSNMLERVMRLMYRYFFRGQHFHGSRQASTLRSRSWALLHNFAPWHPATAKDNAGWRCPAERLNKHRYHDNWLENLLVSASLGGYRNRCHASGPQNP